jgi:hypothetical protein
MPRQEASTFLVARGPAGMAIQLCTYLLAIGGFALAAVATARESFVLGVIALGCVLGTPFQLGKEP